MSSDTPTKKRSYDGANCDCNGNEEDEGNRNCDRTSKKNCTGEAEFVDAASAASAASSTTVADASASDAVDSDAAADAAQKDAQKDVAKVEQASEDRKEKKEPETFFLLQITTEDQANVSYRAPLHSKSVLAMKRAISECVRREKNWQYPTLSVNLHSIFESLIAEKDENENGDEADDEDDKEWKGGIWNMEECFKRAKQPIPDDLAPIDLSSLIEERKQWQVLSGIESKYNDLLSDCAVEPTKLYQVVVLEGWC